MKKAPNTGSTPAVVGTSVGEKGALGAKKIRKLKY